MRIALIVLALVIAACAPKPQTTPKSSIIGWTHTISSDIIDIELDGFPSTLRCSAMRVEEQQVHACRWVSADELSNQALSRVLVR